MVVLSSAIGAVFAGAHPTGTSLVDPLESALFAGCFAFVCSRSARGAWLLVGAVCVVLSKGWLLVPAGSTVILAFVAILRSWPQKACGALIGGLGVQVVLRWPPQEFHGFPALIAGGLFVVTSAAAWPGLSPRLRRRAIQTVLGALGACVLISLPLAIATVLARSHLSNAQAAASAALRDVGGANARSITANLRTAWQQANQASSLVGSWLTAAAAVVPIVAQQRRYVVGALSAVGQTAAVGERENEALSYRNLDYHNGQISIDRLRALAAPGALVDHALHQASSELRAVASPWLLGALRAKALTLSSAIGRSTRSADLAVRAIKVLPGMLGGDGSRTYLIAFMSPAESRAYDGFVGSYGVLSVDDGHIRLTQSAPTTDLESMLPPAGATLRGLPQFMANYGMFQPGKYARNATISPSLPVAASVLAQLFQAAQGGHVDGVLAIDPFGLAALLRLTGPVSVPGLPVPLTAANAPEILLERQYATFDAGAGDDQLRHDFLQDALRAAFNKLVAGSLPAPSKLATLLGPEVAAGRLSFWSFHPSEQPLLRQLGLDGSFPSTHGGDVVSLSTQNSGNNKIDFFLHTRFTDRVTYNPTTGSVSSTLTIDLKNDAPASGLPPIQIANPGAPGAPSGTNVAWLNIYSPLLFRQMTIDGVPGSMSVGRELGVNVFSRYISVRSHGSAQISIRLVGRVRPGPTYRLAVRLQPSANPEVGRISVTPAPGWTLLPGNSSATWTLSSHMRQARIFHFVPG